MRKLEFDRERKLRIEQLEDRRMLDDGPLAPWSGFFGDFNSDDVIDAADYVVWRRALGTMQPAADANGNGLVDPVDYQIWRMNFGEAFVSDYKPSAVIVQTTGVTLPNGTLLDIAGSQTHGLQEAFNYAAAEGWDLFVLPGSYFLNAHLDIEEVQGRAFRLEDVTLNFSPNVTDFAIRFDSTMITDWYWKGGGLSAPWAEHGVLFEPRTPHPLDGQVYGTIGVVDSRFDFGVDIVAATYDVTMRTTTGPVNDALFHFQGHTRTSVLYVGFGFSPTNLFAEARTDDPIPFDLFSTSDRVTVLPPAGEIHIPGPDTIAKVYKPDGKLLSTSGTTTSGLQEAFNYAAANNLDVLVFGRGVRNANPFSQFGYYSVNTPLTVGALNGRTYEIYSVTFNYTPNTGNAMTLSDVVNSRFELTGQVVAVFTNGAGVLIKPVATGVLNSQIRIQHVVGKKAPFVTNVVIDPSLQTIENSEFHLQEMNAAYFGITVANPSASTYFRNNFIRSQHVHAYQHIGIQLGQSETNSSHIHSNSLQIRTSTDGVGGGSAAAAAQIWGHDNDINLIALGSGLNIGIKFEPGSNGNTLYYTSLQATTPIANFGTNNQVTSGPPSDIYGPGSGAGAGTILSNGMLTSAAFFAKNNAFVPRATRIESTDDTSDLLAVTELRKPNRSESMDAVFAEWSDATDGYEIDDRFLNATTLGREFGDVFHFDESG
ncbi:MAG: dockerin type I domain-containing protein [Pirellulales bacterium]